MEDIFDGHPAATSAPWLVAGAMDVLENYAHAQSTRSTYATGINHLINLAKELQVDEETFFLRSITNEHRITLLKDSKVLLYTP